jgi:hypothetical protein
MFTFKEGSLMANLVVVEDKTATISECEIDDVNTANSWKLKDSKTKPRTSSDNVFRMLNNNQSF